LDGAPRFLYTTEVDDLVAGDIVSSAENLDRRLLLKWYFQGLIPLFHGISYMSRGSLRDWTIEEQTTFFTILGDVEASIGVRLNESLLMIPRKSVSRLYFPTKKN